MIMEGPTGDIQLSMNAAKAGITVGDHTVGVHHLGVVEVAATIAGKAGNMIVDIETIIIGVAADQEAIAEGGTVTEIIERIETVGEVVKRSEKTGLEESVKVVAGGRAVHGQQDPPARLALVEAKATAGVGAMKKVLLLDREEIGKERQMELEMPLLNHNGEEAEVIAYHRRNQG